MTEKLKKQVIAPISISASTSLEIRPKIRKRLLDIHTTNLSDSHLLSRKRGFNYVYEVSSKNTELFFYIIWPCSLQSRYSRPIFTQFLQWCFFHFTKQSWKAFFLNKYLFFVISGVWVTSFQHWFKFKNKKIAGSQVWSVLRLGENCHLIFSTKWIDKFELARCRGEWTMSSPAITFFLRSCCKIPLWYSRLTPWQATKQWATAWHWIETVVRGDHLPIHYDLLHEYFSIVGVSRSFK